ncbi:hypothetical protein [Novosphingobium sp. AP12]|uniref:hypothetical protein n=1 Tax=Novosphingobium sp. AP12 TaxID=1144305 RepID=UPI0002721EDC|nr:hypothetical protein [Novosphingobium sp. AP12]EJL30085.1 hypothetical protein PMI02_02144 [Novosphingobium sp. AP12]
MTTPSCPMCNDTGYKDDASLRLDPCDHQRPPALPALLPCPNPACGSTDVHFRSNRRGAQWISCGGCSLSVSDGNQDRQHATWNGLLRPDARPPKAWIYENHFGDAELIFNRDTEYAARLREQGYSEDPLYLGVVAANKVSDR